jgi:hypoxanthine phosphoribosyltransferase
MASTIRLHDLKFKRLISRRRIRQAVQQMAMELYQQLKNEEPLFVPLLNGAFIFISDLTRAYPGNCEISFVKLSSYAGTRSKKVIATHFGLTESIEGRTVVIVDDVIDTGLTLQYFIQELKKQKPKKIIVAALIVKPHALQYKLDIHYKGFEVGNEFLVGYGLDYDGLGRNLPDIYVQAK